MSAINPILLPPNPVWRSYLGGSVLRRFRSIPAEADNNFPEDWLASTVRARNGQHASGPDEGLSALGLNGSRVLLSEVLRDDPEQWFGTSTPRRDELGVLWKLLDSSVRLQFQAHPSAAFAIAHLNSNAGKTECWYIISTRGDGHVYLGFQRPPTRNDWAGMIREQDVVGMLGCFDPIPVKAGDCYVVPAGTPHAIGPGIFMVELMEPTDWVVRCETVNGGLALPPEACFMGLGLDACLDVFDYRKYSVEQVRGTFQQDPRLVNNERSFSEHEIISQPWHQFFRLHRLQGEGKANWAGNELMLMIVLEGQGEVLAEDVCSHCKPGQTWLLPGSVPSWKWLSQTPWQILLLKLPI